MKNEEAPVYAEIPRTQIRTSPQNPRKRMREIDSLAESIKSKGVLEPLLVRPVGESLYEIVAGERRWTAAGVAGVEVLPCIVRKMEAVAALELALAENLERNDLLPMEEAKAFELLMKAYKRTVEDVASKVGRSVVYVRQRLRLVQLIAPLAKLLDDELLDVGGALAVAQFPRETQQRVHDAFYDARGTGRGFVTKKKGERITRTDVVDAIRSFTHVLETAPFLTTDPQLVPAAGACTTCPTRTGRQGELFQITEQADTCLNDECWAAKARAQFDARAKEHKKRGLPVLSDAEAARVLQHGRLQYEASKKYAAVDEGKYVGDRQTNVGAIVGDAVPRMLAFDASTARTVELVERKAVDDALAQIERERAARERARKTKAGPSKEETRAAREREESRRKKAVNERLRIVAGAAAAGRITLGKVQLEKGMRIVIAELVDANVAQPVAQRRGLEVTKDPAAARDEWSTAVLNCAAELQSLRELIALALELLVARAISPSPWANSAEAPAVLVGLGLDDMKAMRKLAESEIKAAAKAKAKERAKAPKPAAAAAGRGKKAAKRAAPARKAA